MYCSVCGAHIEDDSKFCPYCGVKTDVYEQVNRNNSVRNKVFAFVAYGLGITAFVLGFMPIYGFFTLFCSIPALVFSKFGMDSPKSHFARKGRLFAILGLSFGMVISTIFVILIVLFEM